MTKELKINRSLRQENEKLRRRLQNVEGVVAGGTPPAEGERRRCVFEITKVLGTEKGAT